MAGSFQLLSLLGTPTTILTQGGEGEDSLEGGAGDDNLTSSNGNDTLKGGTGNDTLDGGYGSDTYQFALGDGQDVINNADSNYYDPNKKDVIEFTAGISVSDVHVARISSDLVLSILSSTDQITVTNYFSNDAYKINQIRFADGTNWDQTQIQILATQGTSGNDTLQGDEYDNAINGLAGDDVLYGNGGNDSLDGGEGNDYIYGGYGNDTLIGGSGADTLSAGEGNNSVSGGEGNDTISSGSGADSLEGGSGDDALNSGQSNDTLVGGLGNDTLTGGNGSDTYRFTLGDGQDVINNTDDDYYYDPSKKDVIEFTAGISVSDVHVARINYDLVLSILSSTDQITVTNYFNHDVYKINQIRFADGTNWDQTQIQILATRPTFTLLNSSVVIGNEDSLITISMTDIATQSNAADVDGTIASYVVKVVSSGTLLIGTSLATATAWLSGTNATIDATHIAYWTPVANANGNLNAFTVVAKDNGGLESATSVQATVSVTSVNDAPTGKDKTISVDQSGSYVFTTTDFGFIDLDSNNLAAIKVSSLPLLGQLFYNGLAINTSQVLTGYEVLALDISSGKLTYAPTIGFNGNAYSSFQFQVRDNGGVLNTGADLDPYVNIIKVNVLPADNQILTGTVNIDTLTGGAANDTIKGLGAVDKLDGKGGSDLYIITATADHTAAEITDTGLYGSDEVRFSSVKASTLTLYAGDTGIETVVIGTGTAVSAISTGTVKLNVNAALVTYGLTITGNAGANSLTGGLGNDTLNGSEGNDTLEGGLGNDSLVGGAGNDTYLVDAMNDVVTETDSVIATGGTDLIKSAVSYTASTNVENLTLIDTANINATGNALANTLTGNAANNTLDGSDGNDTLVGGLGNDTYLVDLLVTGLLQDTVTETSKLVTEIDTINLRGSYSLATATTVAAAMILAANIENLDASAVTGGTGLLNLVGNTLANTLTGSAANDVIAGAGGTDTLFGGEGNDLFIIALAADHTSTETINGGNGTADEIRFTAAKASTLTLSSAITAVENITIGTGTAATAVSTAKKALNVNVNGTALTYDVTITGNAGANSLTGGLGKDTLYGGAGNDSLDGGLGNDVLTGGKGQDNLTGAVGRDTFTFAAGDNGITATTLDKILDYAKGVIGTGDLIDYSANLTRGGNASNATASQASINQTTGIATFASGSGTKLTDALKDIAARLTAATDTEGESAFFRVNNTGDYYLFVSDGKAGAGVNDDLIQLVGITSIGAIDLTGGNLTIIG